MTSLHRGRCSVEPYLDLHHYDSYRDTLSELDPEDRPAFVRETRERERALRTQDTPDAAVGRRAA